MIVYILLFWVYSKQTPKSYRLAIDRNNYVIAISSLALHASHTLSDTSEFLLPEMLGSVIGFIIDVNVSSLHIRQALELNLQLLGSIVGEFEGFGGIHDNVHFDDQAWTGVISSNGVDLCDLWGVCHCYYILALNLYK